MNTVSLKLDHSQRNYCPGDKLAGAVTWENEEPRRVEIRLFWFTVGIAPRQIGLVEKMVIDRPRFQNSSNFAFRLPPGPYSFMGIRIGLCWAVEVVLLPSKRHATAYFNLGPAGEPVMLISEPLIKQTE
jgi:hypothetical protein